MLSARGWAALGTVVALVLLFAALGDRELLAMAAFLGLAVAVAIVLVRPMRPRVEVVRRVSPIQVHDGDRATVEVEVKALTPLRGGLVEDEVHALGTARFPTGRVARGSVVAARYEIICRPRGIYRVGPAHLVTTDPFGLAENRVETGPVHRLVVYPATEELEGFPLLRGHDPAVQSSQPTFTPHGGEDFYTLREYRLGDDLRRVHWPSTAKRDDLMIRQLEIPWQSKALVLFDTRAVGFPSEAAFETAVRGSASIINHFFRGGYSPDLFLGEAASPGAGNRYQVAMERLAAVQPSKTADLRAAVARLRRRGLTGGALVMVTGVPDEQHLAVFQSLSRDYARALIFAVCDQESDLLPYFKRGGAAVAVVRSGGDWARSWSETMRSSWSTVSAG